MKAPQVPEANLNYLQDYILHRIGSEPTVQMFNLAKLFRLREGIDLTRLSAALMAAGEAHAALRTVLRRNDRGEIVQRQELVAGSVRCPIVKMSEADLLANRAALVKSFTIEGGVLFDATIFDCGGGRAYLLSNFHHLICDGYSFPLVLADAHRAWNGESLEPDDYYGVLARREERASLPFAVAGRNFMREVLEDRNFRTLPAFDLREESRYGSIGVPLRIPVTFDAFLARHRATRHHVFLAAAAIALKKIARGGDVLLDWVAKGGTLAIAKPQLTTRDDRDWVNYTDADVMPFGPLRTTGPASGGIVCAKHGKGEIWLSTAHGFPVSDAALKAEWERLLRRLAARVPQRMTISAAGKGNETKYFAYAVYEKKAYLLNLDIHKPHQIVVSYDQGGRGVLTLDPLEIRVIDLKGNTP